jgi:hypothetical protein
MERAMILRHLELANRHIAEGERHVAQQRKVIASLHSRGADTATAEVLLTTFEGIQRLHVADRDRLQRELDRAPY